MVKTSPSNAGLPVQRVQVQFLVRGLRYHVPKNQDAEQKQCCKNSIKTLRMIHIKKS